MIKPIITGWNEKEKMPIIEWIGGKSCADLVEVQSLMKTLK